jgi:hypothetical protein
VAGHARLRHEAVDAAVAVDQEVGRDVELAGSPEGGAPALDAGRVEVAAGGAQRVAAGVVEDNDARLDVDCRRRRVLVPAPVLEGELDALAAEADRGVDDVRIGVRGQRRRARDED